MEEFDSYAVFYYAYHPKGLLAFISCILGAEKVGGIAFYDDSSPELSDPCGIENDKLMLRYPISRFNDVITILRYEKPLYLVGGPACCVATKDDEPIGEQEP